MTKTIKSNFRDWYTERLTTETISTASLPLLLGPRFIARTIIAFIKDGTCPPFDKDFAEWLIN